MNAYELADELDALFTKSDWEEIPNVVSMLRQQADRIAELEKELACVRRIMFGEGAE